MIKANSSNIEEFGYEEVNIEKHRGILIVKFKNGGMYEYLNVPYFKFDEMKNENDTIVEGSSIGKYLNNNIKGSFEYRQAVTRQALEKELKKLLDGQAANVAVDRVKNGLITAFGLVI